MRSPQVVPLAALLLIGCAHGEVITSHPEPMPLPAYRPVVSDSAFRDLVARKDSLSNLESRLLFEEIRARREAANPPREPREPEESRQRSAFATGFLAALGALAALALVVVLGQ